MTTMVEKMAKAIARAAVEQNHMLEYFDDNGIGYFDDYDNKSYDCVAIARAAIEALMDPTPDVEIAVDLHCNFKPWEGDGKRAWQAGIQAALKEGQ